MNHIKVLYDNFQKLDINDKNFLLYQRLLDLDISDFKPIMEELLSGRLDIEDTRKILLNDFSSTFNQEEKFNPFLKDSDQLLRNNLLKRLTSNDGKGIIKENVIPITNFDDFKHRVYEEFNRQVEENLLNSDFKFSEEDIKSIMIIAEKEFRQTIDWEGIKVSFDKQKDQQLLVSDLLSFKPINKI
ncbi:hypothetical protein [Proteus mirabilis]|uniref:hypothetical protein n=1 Tax=Proteus mirabilis TaxID=584 RepID=UPI0034D3B003